MCLYTWNNPDNDLGEDHVGDPDGEVLQVGPAHLHHPADQAAWYLWYMVTGNRCAHKDQSMFFDPFKAFD